jgi:hypothetical protein
MRLASPAVVIGKPPTRHVPKPPPRHLGQSAKGYKVRPAELL